MTAHNTNRDFSSKAWKIFSRARWEALQRDNCQCVECKTTEVQHMRKYNKTLEVHHKDKNGENNRLSNLQTLCKSCHSKKHPEKNRYRWYDENQLQLTSFTQKGRR